MRGLKPPVGAIRSRIRLYWANRALEDHRFGNWLFAARGFRLYKISAYRPEKQILNDGDDLMAVLTDKSIVNRFETPANASISE